MTRRSSSSGLGELEMRVLLAVLHAGEEAYGVTIRREMETRTGRTVSRGAVYVTLDRLERKGFLSSSLGEPTRIRGGRSKRLFKLRPAGLRALRHSLSDLARMQAGLEPLVGKP